MKIPFIKRMASGIRKKKPAKGTRKEDTAKRKSEYIRRINARRKIVR